jgi:hypothetical protein
LPPAPLAATNSTGNAPGTAAAAAARLQAVARALCAALFIAQQLLIFLLLCHACAPPPLLLLLRAGRGDGGKVLEHLGLLEQEGQALASAFGLQGQRGFRGFGG